jgi:hypothetical protein
MESFADDGLVFSNMVSTAPNTPPSHATIFSGLYPPRHGIRSFFHRKIPDEVNTIFEIFSRNGYETFCAADEALFNDILELSRGCDHFIDHDEGDQILFDKLKDHTDEDIFLFQRFLDVHFPYMISKSPPQEGYLEGSYQSTKSLCDRFGFEFILEEDNLDDVDAHREQWFIIKEALEGHQSIDDILVPEYIKGVNKFDRGRFAYYIDSLEEMGILDDAIVVLMSDHGESVISQNKVEDDVRRFDHCNANVDDLVRVPFVVKGSGIEAKNESSLSSTVDVLPTILDLADIPEPTSGYDIQGRSLLDVVDNPDVTGSPAYSELSWWNDGQFDDADTFIEKLSSNDAVLEYEALMRHRSIRTPKYRYVRLGEELSDDDWNRDPEEFIRTAIRKYRANWDNQYELEIEDITIQLEQGEIDRESIVDWLHQEAILSNRFALYDLRTDPYEEINLLHAHESKYSQQAEELHANIEEICSITAGERKSNEDGSNVGDQVLKNLEDLGYL